MGRWDSQIVEVVGIDGAGKSTLVHGLAHRLRVRPRKVTAYPQDVRDMAAVVGQRLGADLETAFRSLAVASALIQEATVPRSGLDVFDRYIEGARMFFAVHNLTPVSDAVLRTLAQPDLVILLDLDPELAITRRVRPSSPSITVELEYLHACATYLREAAADNGWLVLDARRSASSVLTTAAEAIMGNEGNAALPRV